MVSSIGFIQEALFSTKEILQKIKQSWSKHEHFHY